MASLASSNSFNVYITSYLGAPVNHVALFVEIGNNVGDIYQVLGSIQAGMEYGHRANVTPDRSASFIGKELVGRILKDDYERLTAIVNSIEPPEKQFQMSKRLYPNKPLRRCTEWTIEVVQALRDANILKR